MNQIAEDMTQDENLSTLPFRASPDQIAIAKEERRSEFVRPVYQFKGVELFPFTYGYELLFNQVRDAEDTGLYTWLAFIFLLWKEGSETIDEHRRRMIRIAWRVEDFRNDLSRWMDHNGPFTNEDKLEAKRIYDESMKAIADSIVEPIPDRKRPTQKKTYRQRKQQPSTSFEGS